MNVKTWALAGTAAAVLLGGGWYAWENSGASHTESLCGTPSGGTDAEVATSAQGIAVVEATGEAAHDPQAVGSENPELVTTPVRIVESMKGKFAPVIGVSQRVEPGGAPGSFKVATSNREVMMKPGERYVVAIGPGDLEARPGTTTFATLIQPAHRGAVDEADYWRSVIAKAPPKPACDDTVS
ncbi:hypothetical protein Snoj_26440 [Streptomyces nojiriensis]|uniref:Secreted protein n=1 Tax=Streptomyces nojiriensis TaxID=66374 RepID=A0ABQ3SKQ3_9ACTN|nr:hypothetical protein [Streptomyces nojiriensis]QTI50308.1 hypothetical protein JYK04_08185 [Streptomyces nojiriensis]GGS29865.1 hypothetical protein GCM10010205_70040 [Streptomyces nojiriensis]GHI68726.1 hypothetical protein Snoj_26440 [Streptomyces nojiriensis]